MNYIQSGVADAQRMMAKGQIEAAKKSYQNLLAKVPAHPDLWHLYGLCLYKNADLHEAKNAISKALSIAPATYQYYNSLGLVERKMGNMDNAISCFQSAIKGSSRYLDPLNNLSNLYQSQGQWEKAYELIHKALSIKPDDKKLLLGLGNIYRGLGQLEKAILAYKEILKTALEENQALFNLALCLKEIGNHIEAEVYVDKLLEHNPVHLRARLLSGELLEHKGEISNASKRYTECIEQDAYFCEAYWALANLGEFKFDEALKARLFSLQEEKLTDVQRVYLGFAKAKVLEDDNKYDQSFEQLTAANALKRKSIDYDGDSFINSLNSIRRPFENSKPCDAEKRLLLTSAPIFVVGMPRSGTSLIEQVVASHSQVVGGGELETSLQLFHHQLPQWTGKSLSESLNNLDEKLIVKAQHWFLEKNSHWIGSYKFFTDKLPINFAYVGLLNLLFPNAKFIHISKHPMDACLSCFKQLFTGQQDFSYNLDELATFYAEYVKTMSYWNKLLPEKIYNVSYETLVTHFDVKVKNIFEFLNLPFEEQCLNFHQNQRLVKTASSGQVRQQLYFSSIQRWKKYEQQLSKLSSKLAELGIEYR